MKIGIVGSGFVVGHGWRHAAGILRQTPRDRFIGASATTD